MRKVLYMTNLPVPYKIHFFEELGKRVDLTVAFERRSAENRDSKWLSSECKGFRAIYMKGRNYGEEGAICPQIIEILKKKYDIIIVGTYYTPTGMIAIQYMKLFGIKYFISTDGGFKKNDVLVKALIKKHFLRGADGYFSPGQRTDEYLEYYGADKNAIIRYPFASLKKNEILKFSPSSKEKSSIRESLGIKEKKIIIGVGQFVHRKGWDILLQAAYQLENEIGVYIIGGKPTEEYIEMKNRFKLKHVHFLEFMSKNDLKKYYLAADLFVLPTREDIWGLVINEAMGFGLPVITTTDCMAGLEMVQPGINGYLVDSENVQSLRESIITIVNNESLQKKMSLNAIFTAEKYTIENMADHYLKAILEN